MVNFSDQVLASASDVGTDGSSFSVARSDNLSIPVHRFGVHIYSSPD